MTCTKAMLSVLMDGIKDANMWLDHASEMAETGKPETAQWFKMHAKKRIDGVESDAEYIYDTIHLEEKVSHGDEIAAALHSHIEKQIDDLHKRLEEL